MNPQADVVKKSYLKYKTVKVKGSAGFAVHGVGCVSVKTMYPFVA